MTTTIVAVVPELFFCGCRRARLILSIFPRFRYSPDPMTVYETTNHHTIYHWVTAQGLYPACVKGSPDRIRIGGDDSANPGEDLEPIEWWRWFKEFENR